MEVFLPTHLGLSHKLSIQEALHFSSPLQPTRAVRPQSQALVSVKMPGAESQALTSTEDAER